VTVEGEKGQRNIVILRLDRGIHNPAKKHGKAAARKYCAFSF
jgi:hypothetical protein